MSTVVGIDSHALRSIRVREDAEFVRRCPRSRSLLERGRGSMPSGVPMAWMAGLYLHPTLFAVSGDGAYFEDVDGHRYLDMNQSDLATSLGFAPPPVVEALSARAACGSAFLLPTEDAIEVSEELARRVGMPFWQFTGAASSANAEVIRLARLRTGREAVLIFDGKYHGHIDDVLVGDDGEGPQAEALGLPADVAKRARTIPFNDVDALEAALAPRDVACVLAEPMLTNCNLVFPDSGFWAEAQAIIRKAGSLLVIDEAHTHSFAFGGLTRQWQLEPDLVVLGKGLGSGVAFGAYGMTEPLARLMERHLEGEANVMGLATGGTTYANALALSAARATLDQCLTPEKYGQVEALGRLLGSGLETIFERRGLLWRAPHIGGRSGWVLFPELPRNAGESRRSMDPLLVNTRRVYMANRGIWEAIDSAGPACSFAHDKADVDHYLEVAEKFVEAVTSPT
jgi:glutamate-1-semialdehyde 2,1-aminomutase